MDIVILSDLDFSGNMYNLASFINKYTKHKALAIKTENNPRLRYPTMIHATKENLSEVQELIYGADAVVWKEMPDLIDQFQLDVGRMKRMNNVVILGGGGYSSNKFYPSNQWFYGDLGAKWATSSLDFTEKNPEWEWVPASIRVKHLRETYDFMKAEPPLLVVSPSWATDGMMNVRGKFKEITDELAGKEYSFRHRTVFNVENDVCLHLKADADIFFDRIWDIYGMNSQEAAAFESVVVTGTSEYVRNQLKKRGYNCPFIFIDHHFYAIQEIAYLLENPKEMRSIGRECYKYVKQVHNGELAARNLIKVIRA